MASSSYSGATFCGAGAEGKTGDELLDHFREFVGKVWDSENTTGMVLVLRPAEIRGDVIQSNSVVCFFTEEQLKQLSARAYEEFKRQVSLNPRRGELQMVLVNLTRGKSGKRECVGLLVVSKTSTKASVVKWLANLQLKKEAECVVCYEETGDAGMAYLCSTCGTTICVQCYIDIALGAERVDEIRAVRCPLCGQYSKVTFPALFSSASSAGLCLSEAHTEFVHFWRCVSLSDYSRALRCDFAKMTAKMRNVVEVDFDAILRMYLRISKRVLKESRTREEWLKKRLCVNERKRILETYPSLLRSALRGESPVLRSADDSIATAAAQSKPVRVRSDHCANCQKVFWDKKEKKRAPKCPKCKRVAYCSGACRKKHKRAHSLQCVAGAKAKKKKKAAAKAAKLYGP